MITVPLIQVVTPATDVSLVLLATLKSDLGISGTASDARLTRIIKSVSRRVAAYIGRPLIEQTYAETFRFPAGGTDYWSQTLPRDRVTELPLQRGPVTSILSVVEAGVTLGASLYEWVDTLGLRRLDAGGAVVGWAAGVVVVTYKAGWIGQEASVTPPQVALPDDLYEGAMLACKADWYAVDRDPGQAVLREEVPDVYSVMYDTKSQPGADEATYGLPQQLMSIFDAYRRTPFAY